MKRKIVWVALGVVVLAIALSLAWYRTWSTRFVREYREQLRLARQEGLPTTGNEFAANLPAVRDDENAAPYYAELDKHRKLLWSYDQRIDAELTFRPATKIRAGLRGPRFGWL